MMENNVSILMSIYIQEQASNLNEALASIFEQTFMPHEVVLVEDGPLTPELYEVIEKYEKRYNNIVRYRFNENVQLGNALNKGVELCKNELIARMDSDDISLPNRLEQQRSFMIENSEIACCGSWIEEFGETTNINKIKKMPCNKNKICEYAKYRNPLNHMTVMFRKSRVLEAGNYQHFLLLEDYYLWICMLVQGYNLANIPQVLVRARTGKNTYKRRGGITYMLQFLKLRNKQKAFGILNNREYAKAIVLTIGFTLAPSYIKKHLYYIKLRENTENK